MKRTAGALFMLAALGGCVSTGSGPGAGGGYGGCLAGGALSVPGVQGPWGAPVAMAAPYTATPPSGEAAAREMLAHSVPLEMMQAGATSYPGAPSGIIRAGGVMPPSPGSISAPGLPYQPFVAGMPGGGPGGGPDGGPGAYPPGAVAAVGAMATPQANRFPSRRTEVSFAAPYGMKVSWYAPSPDGRANFAQNHIEAPGRYNFVQGAVYRLKLTDLPNRPGVELYPTLEVVPSNLKTDAFLAHSAVPVSFTNEDLDQVAAGNYLVKVIYLPDPQFQDLAVAGPEEVVSSRLEPGVDPIAEAYRRGSILLVIRLGNIDLELANSPAMDAPGQYGPRQQNQGVPHGMNMPGMGMPGMRMPGMATPAGMGMPGMPMPGMGMPSMSMPGPSAGAIVSPPVMQLPPAQPSPTTGGPMQSSKLPDKVPAAQQTQYKPANPLTAIGDGTWGDEKSETATPSKKSSGNRWWWGGDSDKK
ncbi:MAG TPA: hypothetical protein VGY58_10475 [Gemmataceae bacterium]|nr:hypothetical protein [Gemmataceae bacterium]